MIGTGFVQSGSGLIDLELILPDVHVDIFEHVAPAQWVRLIQPVHFAQVRIETIVDFRRKQIVKYSMHTCNSFQQDSLSIGFDTKSFDFDTFIDQFVVLFRDF